MVFFKYLKQKKIELAAIPGPPLFLSAPCRPHWVDNGSRCGTGDVVLLAQLLLTFTLRRNSWVGRRLLSARIVMGLGVDHYANAVRVGRASQHQVWSLTQFYCVGIMLPHNLGLSKKVCCYKHSRCAPVVPNGVLGGPPCSELHTCRCPCISL